jgi:hypothetical protein
VISLTFLFAGDILLAPAARLRLAIVVVMVVVAVAIFDREMRARVGHEPGRLGRARSLRAYFDEVPSIRP